MRDRADGDKRPDYTLEALFAAIVSLAGEPID
jgi:hypothetical protein